MTLVILEKKYTNAMSLHVIYVRLQNRKLLYFLLLLLLEVIVIAFTVSLLPNLFQKMLKFQKNYFNVIKFTLVVLKKKKKEKVTSILSFSQILKLLLPL